MKINKFFKTIFGGLAIGAKRSNKEENIVAIIPDSGDHYLSGDLFEVDLSLLKAK